MGYTLLHLGEIQMPWNESNRMDERIKFVARLLDGESHLNQAQKLFPAKPFPRRHIKIRFGVVWVGMPEQ